MHENQGIVLLPFGWEGTRREVCKNQSSSSQVCHVGLPMAWFSRGDYDMEDTDMDSQTDIDQDEDLNRGRTRTPPWPASSRCPSFPLLPLQSRLVSINFCSILPPRLHITGCLCLEPPFWWIARADLSRRSLPPWSRPACGSLLRYRVLR